MSTHNNRKSTGMTLLRHLAIRAGRCRKKNPNGIIDITIGDADKIIEDFKQMKFERDEAMRLLGLRQTPSVDTKPINKAPKDAPAVIDPRWAKVLNELK